MWVILVLIFTLTFGQEFTVTEGLDESQKAVSKAYSVGAPLKVPYLYNKAKAFEEVSALFASEADDVASKYFSLKAVNTAFEAIAKAPLSKDELTNIPPLDMDEAEDAQEDYNVNLLGLYRRITFLRKNKGIRCSPKELGRAEAFYEGLIYAIRRGDVRKSVVLTLYNVANRESLSAQAKVKVAIENKLECYTGKPVEVVLKEERPKPKPKPKKVLKKPKEERLKIVARIHFDFNKATIKEEYVPILLEVVKALKKREGLVRIEGYTDNVGPKEYNQKLALKRALAVKKFLIEHGIKEERIRVVGFGKERYISENKTPLGRLTNRRVEFVIIYVPKNR